MNFKYPELLGLEPPKKKDDSLSWQSAIALSMLIVLLFFALFYSAGHHNLSTGPSGVSDVAIQREETATAASKGDVSVTAHPMVVVETVSSNPTVPAPAINAGVGKVE